MNTHSPEPKPRRKWHLYKWLLLLTVAIFAYGAWRAYTFHSALKQAKALGWSVQYTEPFEVIRKNWKDAFKKGTWLDGVIFLAIPTGKEFEQHHGIVQRLNPTELQVTAAESLRNLTALQGLTRLEMLFIHGGTSLTNLDTLKTFPALRKLHLVGCTKLTHVDALKNLSALQKVSLAGCTGLSYVDGLKNLSTLKDLDLTRCIGLYHLAALQNLTALEEINLNGCTELANVNGLKNLSALKAVSLVMCVSLTEESIAALKTALPNAKIQSDWHPPGLKTSQP